MPSLMNINLKGFNSSSINIKHLFYQCLFFQSLPSQKVRWATTLYSQRDLSPQIPSCLDDWHRDFEIPNGIWTLCSHLLSWHLCASSCLPSQNFHGGENKQLDLTWRGGTVIRIFCRMLRSATRKGERLFSCLYFLLFKINNEPVNVHLLNKFRPNLSLTEEKTCTSLMKHLLTITCFYL